MLTTTTTAATTITTTDDKKHRSETVAHLTIHCLWWRLKGKLIYGREALADKSKGSSHLTKRQ